jgi:hypothetical protein
MDGIFEDFFGFKGMILGFRVLCVFSSYLLFGVFVLL